MDLHKIIEAENNARFLFEIVCDEGIIRPGKLESQINNEIYRTALKHFGITKYWHKRIVRAGKNTLFPYRENPADLIVQDNDIMFLDFGPVFEEWEADLGRTYVLGNDETKSKMKNDVEEAWEKGRHHFLDNDKITAAELYRYTVQLAKSYGWKYGGPHCGHLIGRFPHEKIQGNQISNYIHPLNQCEINRKGKNGEDLFWVYEIHFISEEHQIGGFYEQLLNF